MTCFVTFHLIFLFQEEMEEIQKISSYFKIFHDTILYPQINIEVSQANLSRLIYYI
jgi:hypothetical protein